MSFGLMLLIVGLACLAQALFEFVDAFKGWKKLGRLLSLVVVAVLSMLFITQER